MKLLNKIKGHSNSTALILKNGKKISFKKLLLDSEKLQNKLDKRSLVFIISQNNYETIVSYISLLINKSVIMFVDKNLDNVFFQNLIKIYSPNYIIAEENLKLENYQNIHEFLDYKIFRQVKFKKIKFNKDLFLLMTTSGSTGTQKLVMQSFRNYETNTRDIVHSLKINSNDSTITTLPISYTFGLSIINTHLYSGSKIILNDYSIIQKEFWKRYEDLKPSCFYGVPYSFDLLFKMFSEKLYNKKLNLIAYAGGRISNDTLQKILHFCEIKKVNFYSMYGQAEATARISVLDSKYSQIKKGSIGKPIGKGKIKIINGGKIIRTQGVSGSIIFKGDNVCLGYANSIRDLNKKDENKKTIDTGDLGMFDKDGFFYITGRKKRFIKFFGNRISLDEIEKMVEEIGYKINCKNIDDRIVIEHDHKYISKEDIEELLRKKVKINKNYIKFEYVKKFNYTSSGKIIS